MGSELMCSPLWHINQCSIYISTDAEFKSTSSINTQEWKYVVHPHRKHLANNWYWSQDWNAATSSFAWQRFNHTFFLNFFGGDPKSIMIERDESAFPKIVCWKKLNKMHESSGRHHNGILLCLRTKKGKHDHSHIFQGPNYFLYRRNRWLGSRWRLWHAKLIDLIYLRAQNVGDWEKAQAQEIATWLVAEKLINSSAVVNNIFQSKHVVAVLYQCESHSSWSWRMFPIDCLDQPKQHSGVLHHTSLAYVLCSLFQNNTNISFVCAAYSQICWDSTSSSNVG